MRHRLLALGTLLIIAASGCGNDEDAMPADAVATVDGEAISRVEFRRELDRRLGFLGGKKLSPQDRKKVRTEAMNWLIALEWARQEAAKRGVEVSDAEAQALFERTKSEHFGESKEKLQRALREAGLTEAQARDQIRIEEQREQLERSVAASQPVPTGSEVRRYFETHLDDFGRPERRGLWIIETKTKAKALEAKQMIEDGGGWAAAARRYSIDKDTAAEGGKTEPISRTGTAEFDDAVFGARKGEVGGPVTPGDSWWIFEVYKIVPGDPPPFRKVQAKVKRILEKERRTMAVERIDADLRAKFRKLTVCAEGYRTESCSNPPPKSSSGEGTEQPS